jgi:DNA-binding response OmpR family regulator
MLTARSTESDKVLGFEIGADDYLTKPFSTRELVARVRALLRRSGVPEDVSETVERGELVLDLARRVVQVAGRRVDLTTLEFDLLHFLARRPGRVFSRDDLLHQVWGEDRFVDGRSIDSLVSRLRRKIEADPSRPRYVQTVWGAGYRFAERA